MRNPLVLTLFVLIAAVAARSPYGRHQQPKHSVHIRQSDRPAHFNSELDWAFDRHSHHQKMTRKELLMEAIRHIVKSGRLKEHEVLSKVFHNYSPQRLPKLIPQKEFLDSILARWKEPIKPAKPTVIDVKEQEPDIVVETELDPDFSKQPEPVLEKQFLKAPEPIFDPEFLQSIPTIIDPPALPNIDEPVVILPVETIPDEPQGIELIPPRDEPIADPIEIILPEPAAPAATEDEPVPNPIEDVSAIIQKHANRSPTKTPSAVLVELISQLSASLGQLVGVIDQAVEKGTLSDTMVGEIDQLIPGALVDVDQIANVVAKIDKSEPE